MSWNSYWWWGIALKYLLLSKIIFFTEVKHNTTNLSYNLPATFLIEAMAWTEIQSSSKIHLQRGDGKKDSADTHRCSYDKVYMSG